MFKSLSAVFFPPAPSAAELAKSELEDAQRQLLLSQSDREYAEAMVQYHQRRISRLQGVVATLQTAANDTPNQRALRAA